MNIKGINVSRTQLVVFLTVWMCYLLSFFERMVVPPVLPMLSNTLHLTFTQAGSYMTAFYMGYVCTNLPGGLLTDRFGYRKVIIGIMLSLGTVTALMSQVTDYQTGFWLRVLAGVVAGPTFAACMRATFEWFPDKGRGTAVGFLQTGTSIGIALVNLFIPVMAATHGWQTAFLLAGLLPIVLLIVIWFTLKERSTAAERSMKRQAQPTNFKKDILSLFKNKNIMILSIAGFFAMAATWGSATWANTYMNKGLGVTLVSAGGFMASYGLTAAVCKPIAGVLADMFSTKRVKLLSLLLFIFVPTLLVFGANKSPDMLYWLAPLLGLTAYVYSSVMNMMIGSLVPLRLSGTASGFVNTIWQLGSLCAPVILGFVLDHSANNYFYIFATMAGCAFLASIIVLFIKLPTNTEDVA